MSREEEAPTCLRAQAELRRWFARHHARLLQANRAAQGLPTPAFSRP